MTKGELNKFFESFEDATELYVEDDDGVYPAGIRYEMDPESEGRFVFTAYPVRKKDKK
jgi:hypothetical protein